PASRPGTDPAPRCSAGRGRPEGADRPRPPRTCRRASARTPRRGALPPALRDPRARDPESGAAARRGEWWRCCGGRWRRPWPALGLPREGAHAAPGGGKLPGLVLVLVLVLVLGFERVWVLVLVVDLVRVDVRFL